VSIRDCAARLDEVANWDRTRTRDSGSWDYLIANGNRSVFEDGGADEEKEKDEKAVRTSVRSVKG
jgi:hypothetical protein